MSTTVHFGSNTIEFPLASVPILSNGLVSFAITPSITVTAEAVAAALKGAVSYTVTTDGVAGAVQDNFVQSGNVGIDSGTGNIVFQMRQKSAQEITIDGLQAQVAALGQQVVALSLGGAAL